MPATALGPHRLVEALSIVTLLWGQSDQAKSSGLPVHLCSEHSGLWLSTAFLSISDLGEILFVPPTSNSACSAKIFLVHLPTLDALAAAPQVCCTCLG